MKLFVEARILESRGNLRSQGDDDLLVFVAEGVKLLALEIDRADKAVLDDERNRQLRPDFDFGVAVSNVPGIFGNVRDSNRSAISSRAARDPGAKREPAFLLDGALP